MENIFTKVFGEKKEKTASLNTVEDVELLNAKLKKMAYSEAEVDLGTNAQAKAEVGKLGPNDFNYISRVEDLVKEKLNNPEWIEKTKKEINGGNTGSGIKANDELYHSGRGILEAHAKEQEEIEKLRNDLTKN